MEEDRFLSWIKAYISGQTQISFEEMSKEPSSMFMEQDILYATISGVNPSTISAGTGDVLTISGSGFGSSRGSGSFPTIAFRYKDNNYMFNNSYIKSWSDTQIKVKVWTGIVNSYYHSPGSWGDPNGTVGFVNGSGSLESFYPLTVTFGYGGAKRANSSPSYYVNETGSPSGSSSEIQSAANTWNGAGSAFSFNYAGTTTRKCAYDGYNVISFANLGSSTIIGQSIIYISSGTILESDIQFNTQFPFSTDPAPPPSEMDLQSIAVHELGHWLLLLDLYGENDTDKVMYGFGSYGQVKRNLASGDQLGISWIYPEKTPPTPNPMTWGTEPHQTGTDSISMVATTATDPTSPIDYYFDFVGSPTGGLGGADSIWQPGTSYTNSNLRANHKYGYRVKARAGLNNQTAYSVTKYAYTAIQMPTGITFGTITPTSIQARSTNTPAGLSRGSSGLLIENMTNTKDSGWKRDNTLWTSKGLAPNTRYEFKAKARNGDEIDTVYCDAKPTYTRANLPGRASFSDLFPTSIRANWTANGNPNGTQYFCENVTTRTNSGWITDTSWNSDNLSCGMAYSFRVKARNAEGIETGWTSLGSPTVKCIILRYPNGGEMIPSGSSYDIQWDAIPEAVSFDLFYSLDNGVSWPSIERNVRTTPPYSRPWQVPKTTGNKKACFVKVIGYNAANKQIGSDTSDKPFTIEVVTVTNPNGGGGPLHAGDPFTIEWRGCSDAETFDLMVSFNNGLNWRFIDDKATPQVIEGKGVTGTALTTKVPSPGTGNSKTCFIKVIAYNGAGKQIGSDTSDKPFTIEVVAVTKPNGGELLHEGWDETIAWDSYETSEPITKVQLYYTKDGGATYYLITTLSGSYPPGSYSHIWTVPPVGTTANTKCKVKVVLKDAKGVVRGSDVSDNYFTIELSDLIETSVSDPPAATLAGGSFSVTDTAKNQGNGNAIASTTQYYLSVDNKTKITVDDILLTGSRSVPALAGLPIGESSTGTVDVTIPSSTAAGTYYLLACADDKKKVAESNETNNCVASTSTMQVIRPDLIETSVTNPPATPLVVGSSFSVTDTAKNQGKADAGTSTTQYYLSVDKIKGITDILLTGSRSVPALAVGESSTDKVDVTIPSGLAARAYFLLACADDMKVVTESNETNNCIASTSTVQVKGPDLIETSVTNPPQIFKVGSTFAVTDTVKNQGNVDTGPSVTQYYLSGNTLKDKGDILLIGGRYVIGLAPGEALMGTESLKIPSDTPPGAYYLLACADDMENVGETDEKNNCIASTTKVQVIP
jgi:hypothetical protein